MFHSLQLFSTVSSDRQRRFGEAATRRSLVRGNRPSPPRAPSAAIPFVVWPDEIDPC